MKMYCFGWLLVFSCALAQAAPSDQLRGIMESHWSWYLEQEPELRTRRGDSDANNRWKDVSLAAHYERDAKRAEFLAQLGALDSMALDVESQLNHRMLTGQLLAERKRHELGLHLMTMNMRDGPQHLYNVLQYTPFSTEQDYRMWLSRLQRIPVLLAQHTELLEEAIARERVQARIIMERVPAQLDRAISDNPQASPFYYPFVNMPDTIDPSIARDLRDRAKGIIGGQVTPAYLAFRDFFVSSYLPATREEPGVGSLPEGEAIYRFLATDFTTTTMTPEEIHATGKREVARILAEMEKVKTEVGFNGDLGAFNEFLRTDPQFYYTDADALIAGYREVAKRIDPELVKVFGKLPRIPYGVKQIPAEEAPDTTTAYYMQPAADGSRAGYFYVNLYRPEVRPKYEMEVLSVHEAMPGHHLQIALAQELEGLPEFRRMSQVTAFVEGWGLYSEALGYQLGLYRDPYSRYGQLTYDMWRAVRLVVDTGMHYFGWSRQEAIDYFSAHAGKTETDIVNEIDRYIGWPGQALAYKIGQLKILELRALAEQKLGESFDIRSFHDHLLGAGAIPLDALESRMRRWLQQRKG